MTLQVRLPFDAHQGPGEPFGKIVVYALKARSVEAFLFFGPVDVLFELMCSNEKEFLEKLVQSKKILDGTEKLQRVAQVHLHVLIRNHN